MKVGDQYNLLEGGRWFIDGVGPVANDNNYWPAEVIEYDGNGFNLKHPNGSTSYGSGRDYEKLTLVENIRIIQSKPRLSLID